MQQNDAWWRWQAGRTSAWWHTSACSCRAVCTHVAGQFQRPAAVAFAHTETALQLLHIYSIYQMNSAQAVPGLGASRAGLGKGCKLRRTLCSATAPRRAAKLAASSVAAALHPDSHAVHPTRRCLSIDRRSGAWLEGVERRDRLGPLPGRRASTNKPPACCSSKMTSPGLQALQVEAYSAVCRAFYAQHSLSWVRDCSE